MRIVRFGLVIALGAVALVLASCGLTPAKPTATPTPTVLVRPSPTPTPTATPPPATATPIAEQATPTEATTSTYGVVTTDALRVRSGPGTDNEVLTMVALGAVVEVLDKQADAQGETWFRIADGQWIHGGYVNLYTTKGEAEAAGLNLSGGTN